MYKYKGMRRAESPPVLVSPTQGKNWLRVDYEEDDDLIESCIKAATNRVEGYLNRALIEQTWTMTLDEFPSEGYIRIPRPPLISIDTFKYIKEDETEVAVDVDIYRVDTVVEPGQIVLKNDETWPTDTLISSSGVVIEFTAGYGATVAAVPEEIIQAFRNILSVYYDTRMPVAEFHRDTPLPWTVRAALDTYRIRRNG
jgi:uncharacterized phiE125 gp8 family phage protein